MASQPRPSSEELNQVALALDDNMAYAFFVLVHSLVRNARHPFSLIVGFFTGRLSPHNQKLIQEFAQQLGVPLSLREHSPKALFTERRHLTITTFSKFVISDEVPEPHLWLDLDTVARSGWDEFFRHLYTAPPTSGLVVAEKLQSPHTRFEGFNAGVLGWTAKPRSDWLPALASLPEKRFSSEQYLFNTLYKESAHPIDVKFNFLSSWHAHRKEMERSSIIHYSGPIKPWHLARRHRSAWKRINPSWDYWFEAEKSLLAEIRNTCLESSLVALRQKALFSGRLHTGKGALAGWVMRFLAVAGPFGDPLVWILARRATI